MFWAPMGLLFGTTRRLYIKYAGFIKIQSKVPNANSKSYLSPAVYPGPNCETQKEKLRKIPFGAPLGLPFESTYLILICHVVKQKNK